MSSRRLQEDYRRILGITEDVRGIDPALPRMRIAGARGIYQQGDGTTKSGASPSEDADPVTPDETDTNSNDDGSGQGDQNTGDGTGGGGGGDGSDFIIDPEDPPAGVDVNSDTFGGEWASGGVKSFVDCETNQCIELVEVGGYVPPDGWDNTDESFDPTKEWDLEGEIYPTPESGVRNENQGFARKMVDKLASPLCDYTVLGTFITGYSDGGNRVFITVSYSFECSGGNTGSSTTSGSYLRQNKSGDPWPPDAATPSSWPSDNCIQLAPNAEGNWQASDRESPDDMTAKYSEAKSILNVCNQSGEPIDIYQRVGGGFVYFNQTQGIWAGSDSSGRVRSFGSSSTLNQEIARPRN